MEQEQYQNFLCQIVKQVYSLLIEDTSAIGRFRGQIKIFEDMRKVWSQKIEQDKKEADANPRLRNKEAGPPKEGWIWEHYQGFWRPKEFPPDPMAWISPVGLSENARLPNDEEKLMRDYFLLTVIHDGASADATDKHIYFDTGYKEPKEGCIYIWADLNGGSVVGVPAMAKLLWEELSEWNKDTELFERDKTRAKIERALIHVKADLAEKPAETEQNTTPAKRRKMGAWFWTFYEKTLKVTIDAVLERLWPK